MFIVIESGRNKEPKPYGNLKLLAEKEGLNYETLIYQFRRKKRSKYITKNKVKIYEKELIKR